ncbi:fatty acid desaturase family protein [Hahella ganghwensis]|uniref:fatty acid desaturase family protein n=1 Tax=Hahella ganghwensis TaxID=286420 RepID=UPI00036CF906|nr:acyl-CoA desaturase [Hahella ganghwensis]
MMKTTTPARSLSAEQLESLGRLLDQVRQDVLGDLGQKDADYIRGIIRKQQMAEILGRVLIHFSLTPVSWLIGVGLLSTAKILENMEIGHNIMHGQYDWMNDPKLFSQTYEWDTICDGDSWRKTHNFEHHTYTNILGMDRDYGYGLLRLTNTTPWRPKHLFQFINYFFLSLLFDWGVGLHELEVEKIRSGKTRLRDKWPFLKRFFRKARNQVLKDYVLFPLLAGPMALKVLLGNLMANLIRNLWASTIIFCGHFTEGAQTFRKQDYENESRGMWYYRQLLGSSNFTGSRWLHIMSGHLSFQIEHHLFPDIPAHRYREIAPRVRQICVAHGVPYNTGGFWRQWSTVVARIWRYSLPDSLFSEPRGLPRAG